MKTRLIKRTILSLLLGVITTVAVAWIFAALIELDYVDPADVDYYLVRAGESDHGWFVIEIPLPGGSIATAVPMGFLDEAMFGGMADEYEIRAPSYWIADFFVEANKDQLFSRISFGWPLSALYAGFHAPVEAAPLGIEDLPGIIDWDAPGLGQLYLPYYPAWPGFTINTACWASVWWVVFLLLSVTRRRIRKARGQCLHCGYSLRNLASPRCPECGTVIRSPKPAVETT